MKTPLESQIEIAWKKYPDARAFVVFELEDDDLVCVMSLERLNEICCDTEFGPMNPGPLSVAVAVVNCERGTLQTFYLHKVNRTVVGQA
jgi:hypothetical protein